MQPSSRRARVVAAGLAVTTLVPLRAPAEAAAATNLLKVPGFEALSGNFPSCWTRFGNGTASGSVGVSKKSRSGKRALQIKVTKQGTGVRGFTQTAACAPRAIVGSQYDLSLYYKSNVKASVVLYRKVVGQGWQRWYTLGALKVSGSYRKASGRIAAVPPGTTNVRFTVEVAKRGTVVVDDAALLRVPVAIKRSKCKAGVGKLCTEGSWQVRQASPDVRSIHAVVLPGSGKVLLIAGSGNSDENFQAGKFTSQVYDPKTGKFRVIKTPSDMFCAGHVQLPDGRILIMGGNGNYDRGDGVSAYAGLKTSYIFDPRTERYTRTNDMQQGHWYPSATVMGNGDVFSFGGYREFKDHTEMSNNTEQFSWAQKKWLGAGATKQYLEWGLYPNMILMQDGRLFYSGSYVFSYPKFRAQDPLFATAGVFDPRTGNVTEIPGLRQPRLRDQAMSVLLPPAQDQRVMTMGGGDVNKLSNTPQGSGEEPPAQKNIDIIDLKAANPKYKASTENLPVGKMYPSAVLLPDGNIFETSGSTFTRRAPVAEASMINPITGHLHEGMPADPVERTYHNASMLLPDGRVLSTGSNPADNSFETRVSIYTPPYLYKTNRPVITSAPSTWKYGQVKKIRTNGAITRAALIRPAAVTHSSDPNQRYVDLRITNNGTSPKLALDRNRNITPPGWYMLFVVNADGVPSVAKWVKVS